MAPAIAFTKPGATCRNYPVMWVNQRLGGGTKKVSTRQYRDADPRIGRDREWAGARRPRMNSNEAGQRRMGQIGLKPATKSLITAR